MHRHWLGSVVLLVAVAAVVLRPWERDPDEGPVEATVPVTRVVDGDTIVVRLEGRDQYVRLIGVDTPETVKPDTPVQCFGERASHFTKRLLEGRRVRLVFGVERHDVYGRLLAYVHRGPRLVEAMLMRRGLARSLTIPPNDRLAPLFHRLQRRAALAGRGLWGDCRP
jgi:micrococcal nuclease